MNKGYGVIAAAKAMIDRWLVKLGLAFDDPADEARFADGFVRESVLTTQIFLVVGALFTYLFFIWDRIIDPVGGEISHLIRGLFVVPALLAGAGLLFTAFGRRHIEGVVLVAMTAVQLGLVAVYTVLDRGFDHAAVGFTLLFLGTTAAFPIRAKFLASASVFMLATTIAGHLYAGNARPGWLLVNIMVILCAISFGTISAYFRERTARTRFRIEKELERSRARIDDLLHSILPHEVVQRIHAGETAIADSLGEVGIVFADMAGFTTLVRKLSPTDLIRMLSTVFSEFDRQAEAHGVERIKTIGDAYMAIGGLKRSEDGRDHASATADFLLAAQSSVRKLIAESGFPLDVRIGFHIGPVIAGVIGRRRPAFDCWGEAVNFASRLESCAPAGGILVSETVYWRLRKDYLLRAMGEVDMKGIGPVKAYLLEGKLSDMMSVHSANIASIA